MPWFRVVIKLLLRTGLAPARVGFSTMGRGLRQSVHVQLLMHHPSSSGQGNPAPAAAHPFLSLLSPPRYRSGLPEFYVAARMMVAKIQTLELLSGGALHGWFCENKVDKYLCVFILG